MENSANQKLLKQLNEIRLLNIIKQKGPISRSELAKQTRISKVAISDIVNRLNDDGFILEIGKGNSTNRYRNPAPPCRRGIGKHPVRDQGNEANIL
jgi:DNA-binding Lrp family transcriptional regulator